MPGCGRRRTVDLNHFKQLKLTTWMLLSPSTSLSAEPLSAGTLAGFRQQAMLLINACLVRVVGRLLSCLGGRVGLIALQRGPTVLRTPGTSCS